MMASSGSAPGWEQEWVWGLPLAPKPLLEPVVLAGQELELPWEPSAWRIGGGPRGEVC